LISECAVLLLENSYLHQNGPKFDPKWCQNGLHQEPRTPPITTRCNGGLHPEPKTPPMPTRCNKVASAPICPQNYKRYLMEGTWYPVFGRLGPPGTIRAPPVRVQTCPIELSFTYAVVSHVCFPSFAYHLYFFMFSLTCTTRVVAK